MKQRDGILVVEFNRRVFPISFLTPISGYDK
ncbi:MAG: hypothetical protein CFH07_02167 [Alphaproteobacteria bacterium MarineAlpha3_Bin6]|nr:MAG: hypothetical protein CFH07_02167 [Alphaproteobacteria bacterium MarineAlpha3_Bin6]